MICIHISSYSNERSKRTLVYPGIHCWAIKNDDLDKLESYTNDYSIISTQSSYVFALHYATVDHFVCRAYPPKNAYGELYYPPLVKFNEDMIITFKKKQCVDPISLDYLDEWVWSAIVDYQIIVVSEEDLEYFLGGNISHDYESDIFTINSLYSSTEYYDMNTGKELI